MNQSLLSTALLSLLLVFFMVGRVWAKPTSKFRYQLVTQTEQGTRELYSLERTAQGYHLNKLQLPAERLVQYPAPLKEIYRVVAKRSEASCPAGVYRYTAFRNGKIQRRENGCLTDPRFANLTQAFGVLSGERQ